MFYLIYDSNHEELNFNTRRKSLLTSFLYVSNNYRITEVNPHIGSLLCKIILELSWVEPVFGGHAHETPISKGSRGLHSGSDLVN